MVWNREQLALGLASRFVLGAPLPSGQGNARRSLLSLSVACDRLPLLCWIREARATELLPRVWSTLFRTAQSASLDKSEKVQARPRFHALEKPHASFNHLSFRTARPVLQRVHTHRQYSVSVNAALAFERFGCRRRTGATSHVPVPVPALMTRP